MKMYAYAYVGIKIQYTILFVQNTVFKIYLDFNPNICICIHFHKYVIDIKYKFKNINMISDHWALPVSHILLCLGKKKSKLYQFSSRNIIYVIMYV